MLCVTTQSALSLLEIFPDLRLPAAMGKTISCIITRIVLLQAADEVHSLAQQTKETAGRLDELIAALETATAERDTARRQLLVCINDSIILCGA